jgi:glycolate oxidase FAD binding subunit
MVDVLKPASEAELAEMVIGTDTPFEIVGSGSKRGLGRPVQAAQTLDMSGFSELSVYEPEELILEAGAAARLSDIEAIIDAHGQQLAFEPPDFSMLLGSNHSGTLGGVISCNLSGPRRIKSGAARDHILGIRGVSGRGEIFKAGARVVKNVTGYDLPKLMTGAHGTLAALTSITLKVLPKPETEETLALEGLDDMQAVVTMSLAMQSSCEVSGAAHVPGEATYLRLEGIAASVAYRRDALARLLARPVHVLAARSSAGKWKALRDVLPLAGGTGRCVWRLSLTPSEAPGVIATLKSGLDLRYYFDWAGGLVWLDVPSTEDAAAGAIRAAMGTGHAMLFRAPEAVRAAADVFQPQPAALAALSARVKAAFDPNQLFNPGRMYRGV